jgi:tetratricopeptide (TPR) repeat protein
MIGLLILLAMGTWVIWHRQTIEDIEADVPQKLSTKLDRLWDIAQESLRDHKYLRAEKALLTILRVDERNATAYNRLGILYSKAEQAFEQALSLEDSLASRYIAYAKVQEKLGHKKKMFESLEKAVKMEPSIQSFQMLADAYDRNGREDDAAKIRTRLHQVMNRKRPPAKVKQQRKVVM